MAWVDLCTPALVVLWLSWLLLQSGEIRVQTGEPLVGARAADLLLLVEV
jgi:hypothetical protein